MQMRVRVQTVLGDWVESDSDELDHSALDRITSLLSDSLSGNSGYVRVGKGETTTFVPIRSIARVAIEPADDA